MRFIDLFSGIGGFRLGMESVGHECIGFCEIDKFARESYKSIFQTEGEIEFHDIRDVSDDEFKKLRGKVDVICGGFPCQAFSIAGRRLGFEDTRGTLFFEIARAAKQIQPRFLFLENVKGLLNHDKGRTFTTILTTLDELGFDVEWQMLNSKDFGVPQNRERVFIIGHSRKRGTRLLFPFRREGQATNPETLKILGNLNPSKSGMSGKVYYSEGLAPTLVRGKGEGFKIAIPCMTPDRLDKRQNGRRFKDNQEPMFTLNTQDRHGIVVVGDLPTSFKETGRVYGSEGLSPTLTTMQGGDKIPKILIPEPIQFLKVREATKKGYAQAEIGDSINLERPSSQHRRGRVGKGIANTLTTSGQMGVVVASYEGEDKQVYQVAGVLIDGQFYRLRIRRITPKECFRLQGFPDWAFEAARKVSSNSQLYKQAGNSVTVPVIAAIAKKLKEVEEKMKALNKESILDCDELETELHDAEIKQLDEQIFLMPNYPCEFEVTFLDDYHKKHNYPLFYESYLQNIMEFLESQDIKNGADAFVDDHQNLVFVLYGQGYRAEGKEGILTTQVTVKAFDEDKKPINFANLLDSLIVSEYQMEPNLWRSPMIDLYLVKISQRNQLLLDFFQNYGIDVSCHSVSEMTKDKLIEMMSYSSDCFEFLSPNLLRFKNRDNLKLTDFIEMILKNLELTIRLPLAVSNKRVYPSLNLEEARVLLPRDTKQLIYMAQTHYLSN
ncbi:DNA (cytosine-5-)-methyltransferase family protein [Streptococcus pneumoniae GA40563]|nr:DNA (cytosine-5-)-methyltransferase family protein [Streptococcus pneumoniae GA40563]